ncbi:MAG: DUF115 domain-containing protein, partial [Treponema sp.]|nr:DUF115 domain-containing protein [Treponema sp.]
MESPKPWDINSPVLQSRFPGLAEILARERPPEEAGEGLDIRAEASASGPPTLVVKGLHVHSPRDPAREGRRAAEGLSREGPIVFLGFGLGYAPEAAAARFPGRPLVIVERRPEILKKALESRDLTALLKHPLTAFVVGGSADALIGALRLFAGRNGADGGGSLPETPELIRNRALLQIDESWYAEAERHIKSWLSRDEVNQATLKRFGKRWVRNLAANREAIRDLPGIARLENCLLRAPGGPFPVFLAAAGPSLDRLEPFLEAIAERCVILAVDTSLRFLLSRGIDPDFAVAVDPQYWNARHLDRAPARRTCLIAESAVYPPVLRHPFGRAFLCGSLFPLGRFIEDRLDPKGALGAGGSVATTAWDFARVLGASAIWIAGLDLAFPELKTHFKGALFEERALAESLRLNPVETWSVRALRDGRPFQAPSAGGGRVLTDQRLSLYAAWFENRFRQFPRLPNYRLSAEGIALSGTGISSPQALLDLPIRRQEINRALKEAFARIDGDFYAPEAIKAREERYRAVLESLLGGLKTIRALAEDGARAAERAWEELKSAPRDPGGTKTEKILKKLDKVNHAIETSEIKDVAGFLFPPAGDLQKQLTLPGEESLRGHLEFSARFYRALA